MRQQHVVADTAPACRHPSTQRRSASGEVDPLPLLDKALAVVLDTASPGVCIMLRQRRMMAIAKRDRQGELAVARHVDLAHHGDVAVQRLAELPVHRHVVAQVLIAVARADKPAGRAGESAARAHRQRDVALPRQQTSLARDLDRARRVARAAAFRCGASSA